jgi:uncharacterized protein YndB with AHSA1/START domain
MSEFGTATARDTLTIERLLPGPVQRVWGYLVDPEKRAMWFAGGTLEPRVGGKLTLHFDHDKLSDEPYPAQYEKFRNATFEGTVLAYDPPREFAFSWGDPGEGNSEVHFALTPRGNDTLLVITHTKVRDRNSMVQFAGGWHSHLAVLQDLLAGRKASGFWSTHEAVEKEYQKRLGA